MKTYLQILALTILFPFCASAQNQPIPNGSFEVWDSMNPQSWDTNNNATLPPFQTFVVLKDKVNKYHGKYAMMLMYNRYYPAWASTTFANTGHPSFLEGYVKCDVIATDTVSIQVEILSNGQVVNTGYWESLVSINEWTKVSIPVTQSDIEVFETRILITGGRKSGSADETSTLWVDSLALNYTPVQNRNTWLAQNDVDVFPNPSAGVINIQSNRADLVIEYSALYHLTGIKILDTKENEIDTKAYNIPKGAYYLWIKTNRGNLTKQLVILDKME